jgi:drug/metabolite transporter (DMT)-like permease
MISSGALLQGVGCALAAGLMWGLVFVAPVMLPEYPAALLTASRYLAFGILAVGLAVFDWSSLQQLKRSDWIEAVKLSLVGNLLYYSLLASAIQLIGAPVPTMLIGSLPVVIAICSNVGKQALPWRQLAKPLALIAAGIALVQYSELALGNHESATGAGMPRSLLTQLAGIGMSICAVACWTWYPIRNARWLQSHPQVRSSAWATAQGLTTLPLSALLLAGIVLWSHAAPESSLGKFAWPLGPKPWLFLGLMLAIGLLASWLGTLLWNRASQLLPTSLSGQLIVFETLSALVYAYSYKGRMPPIEAWLGVALLVAGVVVAVRVFQAGPPTAPGATVAKV